MDAEGESESVTRSSDPRLVASRIFIGNLPTDKCSQQEVKDHFQKYGVVLGVSLFKGFGFVQFRELPDAQNAVYTEHQKYFKGQKMDIRLASEGRKKREIDMRPAPPPPHPRMPDREAPPLQRRRLTPEPPYRPEHRPYESHYGGPTGAYDRHGLPLDPYYHGREHIPPQAPRPHPVEVLASMGNQIQTQQYNLGAPVISQLPTQTYSQPTSIVHPGLPVVQQSLGRGMPLVAPQVLPAPAVPVAQAQPEPVEVSSAPPIKKTDVGIERPFDCAILVADKGHRSYAEMVERRLLELNLSVDLLFLIEQDAISKLVETFSHKGLLYLIVIQKQHEEHKSVTVNILHGTPQEHRNMPLEDALLMLSRDFNGYLSKLRCGSEQPSLNFLLHLISDGKNLSHGELDRAIQHLTDRKNHLMGTSNVPEQQQMQPISAPAAPIAPAPMVKPDDIKEKESSAAELQKKIMSILGSSSGSSGSSLLSSLGGKSSTTESSKSKVDTPLSQGPGASQGSLDIHKTLNNLLQNPDALKNILPKQQPLLQNQPQPPSAHPLNPYDSRAQGVPTSVHQNNGSYGNGFMGDSYRSMANSGQQRNEESLGMTTNPNIARGTGGRGLLDNPVGHGSAG